MIPANAIRQYKSPVDEKGGYRMYFVYQSGNQFIFECWDCSLTARDGSSVGGRKGYGEFSNVKDAIAQYEQYLDAWEPASLKA